MEIKNLPALGYNFLFVDNLLTEEENNTLVELCYNVKNNINEGSPEDWTATNFTTFRNFDPVSDSKFNFYSEKVQKAVNTYAHYHDYTENIYHRNGWINYNRENDYVEEHTHANSRISCIYYAKIPENSKGTIFKSPYIDMLPFPKNHDVIEIEAVEKRLLVFRSFLPHLVESGTNKKDRITLASNYL